MAPDGTYCAVGAISGTSMDGIDVSWIKSDGDTVAETGPGRTYTYDPNLRARLAAVAADPDKALTDPLTDLERDVTDAHTDAVRRFIKEEGLEKERIDFVGLHGQTVCHRPEKRFTRQLCDAARAAAALGIDVVADFRQADVAAGGQGAPLAPLYHRALVAGRTMPVVVLNWGGVGNVTYIDGETILAFDTGPASALIDDFVARRTGSAFDANGRLAASGAADDAMVASLMADPFFAEAPPKSLDRNHFHARAQAVDALSDADGAATLAAFTIAATLAAQDHFPRPPREWQVAGGGRHNGFLMARLQAGAGVPVRPVEEAGLDGDFLEAQCFAYLAIRSHLGLPLSLPTTTGVPEPMPGGRTVRVR